MRVNLGFAIALVRIVIHVLEHLDQLPEVYAEFRSDLEQIHRAVDRTIEHIEAAVRGL